MRVEILKLGAGPEGSRWPKQICEVSEDEGRALIADNAARELPPADAVSASGPTEAELEAAAVTGSETATAPPAPEDATAPAAAKTATAPPAPERRGRGDKKPRRKG